MNATGIRLKFALLLMVGTVSLNAYFVLTGSANGFYEGMTRASSETTGKDCCDTPMFLARNSTRTNC